MFPSAGSPSGGSPARVLTRRVPQRRLPSTSSHAQGSLRAALAIRHRPTVPNAGSPTRRVPNAAPLLLFRTLRRPASNFFQTDLCHSAPGRSAPSPQRSRQQQLPDGSSLQRPCLQQLCHGPPASNKPHLAERSTPVWLAIWRIWAGFANSQHRYAAFVTPNNICTHSSLLPHRAAAQTDANLSAHLPRLPTPPPYLRRTRLLPGWGAGIRCWRLLPFGWGCRCLVLDMAATRPGASFLQITARTNPCSRHLWGTLARAVASI